MRTNKKSTLKERAVLIGIPILSAAVAVYKKNQSRTQIYKELLKNDESYQKDTNRDAQKRLSPKRILITGQGSYIGESVRNWLAKYPESYAVDTVDMIGDAWKNTDFSVYDVVYHVAGIAHADVGSVTEEQKKLYYQVNTDLAVEVAECAKKSGVKQFIFMSSMIVYSGCREKMITENTKPQPLNFYGDSKWQADQRIQELQNDRFNVVILRPPMIYGKGSKGNYPELAKLAVRIPAFPKTQNRRSMLHIDNLCEFVKLMIDNEESGVFFPQNAEYTNTSEMVQMIATVHNHMIVIIPGMLWATKLLMHVPGKIGALSEKVFGDLAYDMSMSAYKENYRVHSLIDSIKATEETK